MPDIYEAFTEQEATSKKLDEYRLTNFAYDSTAFSDTSIPENVTGQDVYDYNAHNNIPKTPELSTSTQTLGLGSSSGVFKRSFWNHYAGRISYNLNKAVQALMSILGSFRSDYSENISEYSEYASYAVGDVCYRLNDDEIIFYRCVAPTPSPAGDFNGIYWEKPEEELAYSRPAVGVPVLWFEKVPEWAIRLDDGRTYKWTDAPALNFEDFRNMLLGLQDFGASVPENGDGFTVAKFYSSSGEGYTPMFEGGDNEVQTDYSGDAFTACLEDHAHGSYTTSFLLPNTGTSHTHTSASDGSDCSVAGAHSHVINNRCNYDSATNENTSKTPVDRIEEYAPATLTNAAGEHTHSSWSEPGPANIGAFDHVHNVTVSGQTGGVEGVTGGNPDGFQSCWIVRYR